MEAETWKHVTLGDRYQTGITKFRQARRSFKHYSPLKFDLMAARNLWGAISPLIMAPILHALEGFRADRLLPPVVDITADDLTQAALRLSISHKPWYRRTELVNQTLVKAWELGYRTYAQLIEQVRLWTGQGCSKRAISRFVKERRQLK
ncbi:MAG: hypothetical protein KME35_22590 [Aphanocapsa sp. GSE-SYN-MK-11-07L]|jgi:hypothetical protein|nr:hypothetical protein [Aphanocapsa sp. GSE-SYN-MK-11-07L]